MKPLIRFIDTEFAYDGSQLTSLFAYKNFGLLGDSIVAWIGPCNVKNEHMKDGEDLRAGEEIRGDRMVHFIIEKFDIDLFAAVSLQRLITATAVEVLTDLGATDLTRDGDDIFLKHRKLSISIATSSPISKLIHFAVNVVNEGTPVKTLCLDDLGVEPKMFAQKMLECVSTEIGGITAATRKVFPTG